MARLSAPQTTPCRGHYFNGVDLAPPTVMMFQSKHEERRTIPLNQTVLSIVNERGTLRSFIYAHGYDGARTHADGHVTMAHGGAGVRAAPQ